jgi:hypothetical protein
VSSFGLFISSIAGKNFAFKNVLLSQFDFYITVDIMERLYNGYHRKEELWDKTAGDSITH